MRLNPRGRLILGLSLMVGSLLCRGFAALLVAVYWGNLKLAAICAVLYAVGKGIFYVGLALAGPAAVQRYPWLRPANWFRRRRLALRTVLETYKPEGR
jgi:hypothetical protein